MPRASGQKEYISLVKGVITEASPLAFPEGTTFDELNFTIDRDGLIRKRRRGFKDIVTPFTYEQAGATVENVFYWRGPSLVCVVVTDDTPQTVLRFHAVDVDFSFIIEIPIATQKVETQIAETTNLLAITTDNGDNPVLCEYDSVAEAIVVSDIALYVRDFELVDDELAITDRPATLSDDHSYNLFNAGWYQFKDDKLDANINKRVTDAFFDSQAEYPSNADIVSVGLIIDNNGDTVFDATEVVAADLGNSLAPRGHYIFPIVDFDRTARELSPSTDGAVSTTLSPVGTISLTGVPTYDPDDPGETTGPGGDNPTNPPIEPPPPGTIEP